VRAAVPEEFDRIEKDLARVSQDKLIAETEVTTSLKRGLPPDAANGGVGSLDGDGPRDLRRDRPQADRRGQWWRGGCQPVAGVGTPTLDGFGIVGGNIHTPEEYAEVASVAPRIYLLSRMIMELAK
jgi:glutamate carboxypeptidase